MTGSPLSIELRSSVFAPFAFIVGIATTVAAYDACLAEHGRIRFSNARGVAVSGPLVAAVEDGKGLSPSLVRVAEISSQGLHEVGVWESAVSAYDIKIDGSTAFVTEDFFLIALDLSDPGAPTELGSVSLRFDTHLSLDDGFAYCAGFGPGGDSIIDIFDVTDPAEMKPRGYIYWGRPAPVIWGIDASDGVVVIADGNGVLVLDVSDPWAPTEIGRWDSEDVQDVALVGHNAAVAVSEKYSNPHHAGIIILDLADPTTPTPLGFWSASSTVHSVATYGAMVLAGTEANGLYLLDISDPADIIVTDRWFTGQPITYVAAAWPTIAYSSNDNGAVVLGRRKSCIPPRRPAGRRLP